MSNFTDDDLMRVKESLKKGRWIKDVDVEALIARLEAAEKVCVGIQTVCNEHKLKGQAAKDIEAWRKAAGK